MYGITYSSRETKSFDDQALYDLAEHASAKNERLDITGYLCFKNGRFFQYLEGEKPAVAKLMGEIVRDDRHQITRILELGQLHERVFPTWSMRYLQDTDLYQIHMEDVLEQVLTQMSSSIYDERRISEMVLRMVEKIARELHPV